MFASYVFSLFFSFSFIMLLKLSYSLWLSGYEFVFIVFWLCRYIQWLIEDQDCDDTQFHTLYALSLAKSAIEADNTYQNADIGRLDKAEISDNRMNSIFESPVRERLQIFLQSSDLYDPEEVLDLIEGSELWLEKVHWNSYNYLVLNLAFLIYTYLNMLIMYYWDPLHLDDFHHFLQSAVRSGIKGIDTFLVPNDWSCLLLTAKCSSWYYEQAILYRKLGQEALVLQILAL